MGKINFCTVEGCHSFGRYCRAHQTGQLDEEDKAVAKAEKAKAKKQPKKSSAEIALLRKTFFDTMIAKAPERCEESKKPLKTSMRMNPRTIIAHILPKRSVNDGGVPSMQFEPKNVMYFDQDVHTNYDLKGSDHVKSMKTFGIMKRRVAEMWDKIPQEERKNVPDYFKPE